MLNTFRELDEAVFTPERIVTGGQTGVDRGALDAALALRIPHGGFCPAGRLAEDGVIPSQYDMTELESRWYPDRTEKNVVESDATLILHDAELGGGTALTLRVAVKLAKPCLTVCLDDVDAACHKIRLWLADVRPAVLNVAGPRESSSPGIHAATRGLLVAVLS